MKTRYFINFLTVLALLSFSINAAAAEPPYIAPILDQTAVVGELFTLDVDAELADPPETYELLESRPGMAIIHSTGLISWTPASPSDGGRVTVRAYNSAGESIRSFFIYLNEGVVCDPDLVSYWTLDETAGSIFQDVTGGYDAVALSPVTDVAGVVGRGKQLSPVGKTVQYLVVNDQGQNDFPRSQGFTVSLWVKWDGDLTGENQVLVARGDPSLTNSAVWFNLMVNQLDFAGPKFTFEFRPRSSETFGIAHGGPYITPGEWYHVVAVYKGTSYPAKTTMNVYVNGVTPFDYDYTPPDAGFTADNDRPWNIGFWDRYPTNKYPFNGVLDEVQMYDRALQSWEITQIYNNGQAGLSSCLPGNYYPLITSVPVETVAQDVGYSYTLVANDYDNDNLTMSAAVIPSWASFNSVTGILSGTPSYEDVGSHSVRLVVSDGTGATDQEFTINVTNVNDAPVFTSTPITTATEDAAYSYSVTAEDPDGDNLTYSVGPGLASWLSFNPSTKLLVGIPQRPQVGDHFVTIHVSDGEFQATQQFTITVISNNNAPVITSTPVTSVNKLSPYSYMITASDADAGDFLTYSAQVLPTWLAFNPSTHLLSGTPENHQVGDHPVSLIVSDGYATTSQNFTVTVNNVNTPPQILSVPSISVKQNELYSYFVEALDYENDPLTLNGILIPNWLVFDPVSRLLFGTPTSDQIGNHTVIITVTDGIFIVNHQFVVTVESGVGIEEVSTLVSKVFPNPAEEYVILEFAGLATRIEISDLSGKVLIEQIISKGANKVQIDVSDLDNGMYMFRVFNNSVYQSGKIVIN